VDISNGDFVFSLTESYLIEDGKITAPLKGVNLIGNGPDVLRKRHHAGQRRGVSDGIWTCGKDGQSVPVGVGCPTVKISAITVGGTPQGLYDPRAAELDAVQGLALARTAEAAARGYDPRITNSDGGSFSRSRSAYALVTSGGFRGAYEGSNVSLVAEPVADDRDGRKQTAAYWDSKRFVADLEDAEAIGREAGRRCVAKLGAKKVPTAEVPVVFHPDAAAGLLGLFLSCVSGGAIFRRSSYLCGREGEQVADARVSIVDDPLIVRGPASRPFDGEGLASRRNVIVQEGALVSYLLDTYSGRKLGKASTGSAARGTGGSPHPAASNFVLQPGTQAPEAIIGEVEAGLYVTHTMGFGFNAVTGDFSRGAAGFWIEKGQLTHAVAEVTVSLGFDELWRRVDAVGSDLRLRSRVASPTLRVSRMTVAGG
jgi:PmbA protein